MPPLPPLNALRAFEAAARHSSFKLAAEELCVTPGAVSRHILNLENFVGMRLFIRRNRQVSLTPTGAVYVNDVRQAFERLAQATSTLCSGLDDKILRLKLPPTFAVRWLVPRLAGFLARHPDISIQVATSPDPVDFTRDNVDVAVHYGTALPEGIAGEKLLGEVLLPVCNPTVAANLSARRPRDLAAGVLLHSARRPHDWPAWFSAAGVHDLKIEQEILFENSGLTVQGAIDGMGIAIAQAAFVTDEMKTGRLVSPLDLRLKTALGYYLVFPPEKLRRKKVQLFQAWVAQEAAGTRG